jgi:hypothetical protein
LWAIFPNFVHASKYGCLIHTNDELHPPAEAVAVPGVLPPERAATPRKERKCLPSSGGGG